MFKASAAATCRSDVWPTKRGRIDVLRVRGNIADLGITPSTSIDTTTIITRCRSRSAAAPVAPPSVSPSSPPPPRPSMLLLPGGGGRRRMHSRRTAFCGAMSHDNDDCGSGSGGADADDTDADDDDDDDDDEDDDEDGKELMVVAALNDPVVELRPSCCSSMYPGDSQPRNIWATVTLLG